ncbi:MAG: hypothetical protein HN948_00250 [Clostridia bacterium]|nr:hypothetical protein [Clostridia bacterium]MBT7121418.1 hypothetical protein [Clostridia bacterium]
MFGYVQPLQPELKVKEQQAYKGYYCGLCKAIKEKYTNTARFMLSYDCAVLMLLLGSMSEEVPEVVQERCAANPLKRKTVVRSEVGEYAAAINVMLGYGKVEDTYVDDKKFYARILMGVYKRVNSKASSEYEALADEFAMRMSNLRELERSKSDNIDAVSGEFAKLLAAVFSMAPFEFMDERAKKAMWHFGYNLGRWIYIADAVDDILEDETQGSYNVYLQREYSDIEAHRQNIIEEARFNLHYSLSEACKAYELLDIKRDKELLDNIMYLGLAKKTEDILKGDMNGSV